MCVTPSRREQQLRRHPPSDPRNDPPIPAPATESAGASDLFGLAQPTEDVDFDSTSLMGALMNRHDWSDAALPAPERWPQRLWALVDLMLASPLPAFIAWGPELGVLYNDAAIPVVGGRHPLLLGSPLSVAWPDLWHEIRPQVDRVLAGEPVLVENQRLTLHRDGNAAVDAWFDLSYSPIGDRDGTVQGVYCMLRYATGQALARQLRESEAQFRTITEAMPQLVWSTRPDGHHDYFNSRYYDFTGVPEGASDGDAWLTLYHPADRERTLRTWHHSLATGEPYEIEYRMRHRSGEYRWVLGRALPLRDEAGRVTRWLGTCTDIHEQVMAREVLRREANRKDEFLAMLAHELRNPLAPIRTAATVLPTAAGDTERTTQLAQVIARQVQHMTRLVDDLLDVSRVTRGLVKLDFHRDDLKAVVNSAIEQVRPLIEERRHTLTISMAPGPVPVRADRTRLVQVVANLLNNAAKYTPRGGRIDLCVTTDDHEAVLVVRDNGPGIDSQLLPRLFDLFTQGPRDPARSPGGLGIGLALARSIALMHGGQLVAASEGRGRGSGFMMRLPLAKPGVTSTSPTTRPEEEEKAQSRCHVIVVDDNIDAARTIALALEIAGHQVEVHHDAAAVLAASAVHPAQVYIIDIGLPDMPGYELAQALRAESGTHNAILIALTGYGRAEDRARSAEAGFDKHLVKPVDVEELRRIIDGLASSPPIA